MNKVILIGNLTRDPELSETSAGVAYCRFSIAVNRDYSDDGGNREVDYFNVIVWRGRAETCAKYLVKGSKVAVIGSLQTGSYDDKDGIKRYTVDVVASDVEFLTPRKKGDLPGSAQYDKPENSEKGEDNEKQLPF